MSQHTIARRPVFTDLRLANYRTDYTCDVLTPGSSGVAEFETVEDLTAADFLRWEIQRRDEETHDVVSVEGAFEMTCRLSIDRAGNSHDLWTVAWVGLARRVILAKDFPERAAYDLIRTFYVRFCETGKVHP